MQNNLKCFALLACIGWTSFAFAETVSDSLTRIESETLILKAREKQLEAQSNIIARQSEIAVKQAVSDLLSQVTVASEPVIRSIEGIGRTLYATLQLHNGNTVEVQAGDVLPNGMRIVSIRPQEVIAETAKKRRIRLAAVSSAPAANVPTPVFPAAYQVPGNMGMPSLPALPVGMPAGRQQ